MKTHAQIRYFLFSITLAGVLFACDERSQRAAVAGVEAGVSAGAEAGAPAGAEAGVAAGVEAGVAAGVEAGVSAGVEAGAEVTPQAPYLTASVDRPILGQGVQGFSLTLTCRYFDASGVPQPHPEDLRGHIDSPNAHFSDGRWSFSAYGVYTARCSSTALSLMAETPVVVYFEGMDHRYQSNIHTLYQATPHYKALIDAFIRADEPARGEALSALRALSPMLPAVTGVSWVAPHPTRPWPGAAELRAAGLSASPEDAQWLSALRALEVEADAAHQWWLNLRPDELVEASLSEQLNRSGRIKALARSLSALEVTPSTAWLEREALGAVMCKLTEAAQVSHQAIIAYFEGAPLPELNPGGLSVVSMMTTLVVQGVLDSLEDNLGPLTYHDVLKDVSLTLASSVAQVGIKELLNLSFDRPQGAPSISSIHGPAGGFMGGGLAYQVLGSFPGGSSAMRLLVIPPRYTLLVTDLLDIFNDSQEIFESTSLVLKAQEIERIINIILTAPDLLSSLGGLSGQEAFLSVTPSDGTEEHLIFSALPIGLNCNQFMLPSVGTVIPLSLVGGRGEAVNVNFYGESQSACR